MAMVHVMFHSNVHTTVLSKCIHILIRLTEYYSFHRGPEPNFNSVETSGVRVALVRTARWVATAG